jgi:hypothetical protein
MQQIEFNSRYSFKLNGDRHKVFPGTLDKLDLIEEFLGLEPPYKVVPHRLHEREPFVVEGAGTLNPKPAEQEWPSILTSGEWLVHRGTVVKSFGSLIEAQKEQQITFNRYGYIPKVERVH